MAVGPQMGASAKLGAPEVCTVTQLTRRVKGLLEGKIGRVWVAGEISNFRVSPAGHAYFTLKDDQSQLAAVMFKGRMAALKFKPDNGLEVVANGLISVYEQRGQYQIICDGMTPKGLGALQLAFEQLKRKLEAEGLFDPAHKKPLPMLPRRIGIVTSPTGAAIRDILNVLERRYANVHILLYPARVQGEEAAGEIVAGIRALDEYGVDVMIVGRGGGSLEDLWAFNEEPVVRAVFEAKTPIISAVGHEIDFTLCDFVADLRAPTPSAAAELVVKEQKVLIDAVRAHRRRIVVALGRRVEAYRYQLDRLRSSSVFRRPGELVREQRQRLDELRMGLETSVADDLAERRRRLDRASRAMALLSPRQQIRGALDRLHSARPRLIAAARGSTQRERGRFAGLAGRLDALSPLAILARGYAVAWKLPEEMIVTNAASLAPNDELRVRFGEGEIEAIVSRIRGSE